MEKKLHEHRKSYNKDSLNDETLQNSPSDLFEKWFNDAEKDEGVEEANAMSVSTIGEDGFPKTRVVLLKEFDDKKLIFYTNYTSEKGVAISQCSNICIHFFWPSLERQIIIKAHVNRTDRKKSAAYFQSRPRGSQLGAWASNQSDAIKSRDDLEAQLENVEQRFKDQDVPVPEFWGGYECYPVSYEFWQGRPNRLHDRIVFKKNQDKWLHQRLQPYCLTPIPGY